MNYKCIVAIKLSKKTQVQVKCIIRIQEYTKLLDLPNQESQFFDIQNFASEYITIDFQNYGVLTIQLPQNIQDEIELSDHFELDYLKGKYYVLIIKSQEVQFEEVESQSSPLRHYLKSYITRNKERKKKTQTKALLDVNKSNQKKKVINDVDILKQEVDRLKSENALIKLKENTNYKQEFDKSEIRRKELQHSLQSMSQEMVDHNSKLLTQINGMNSQIHELKKQLVDLNKQYQEIKITNESLNITNQQQDNIIKDLQSQIQLNNEVQNLCMIYSKQKNDLETELQRITEIYNKELLEYRGLIRVKDIEIDQKQNEQEQIIDDLQNLNQQFTLSQKEIASLKSLNQQLIQKLDQIDQFKLKIQQKDDQLIQLKQELSNKDQEIQNKIRDINLLQQQINFQNSQQFFQQYEKEIEQLKQMVKQIQIENQQLKIENNQANMEKIKIPILMDTLETLKEQILLQYQQLTQSTQSTDKLHNLVKNQAEYLNQQLQQINDLKSKIIQKVEIETNQYKYNPLEYDNKQQVYIPLKNDEVDNLVSQYINNNIYKDKYLQLFKRESEGIYQIGNRKVFLKQEQGKLLVKLGGGYVSLDEFLNQNEQKTKSDTVRKTGTLKKSGLVK